MTGPTTPQEKLAWLRANVDPALPDIYHQPGFTPNGCGPASWRLLGIDVDATRAYSFLGLRFRLNPVPNRLFGLPPFDVAGDLHDWRYWMGGTEAERLAADVELRATMRKLVRVKWWNPRSWLASVRMNLLSQLYFDAVRMFGAAHFHYRKGPQ